MMTTFREAFIQAKKRAHHVDSLCQDCPILHLNNLCKNLEKLGGCVCVFMYVCVYVCVCVCVREREREKKSDV